MTAGKSYSFFIVIESTNEKISENVIQFNYKTLKVHKPARFIIATRERTDISAIIRGVARTIGVPDSLIYHIGANPNTSGRSLQTTGSYQF